jgi:hypothetical protein
MNWHKLLGNMTHGELTELCEVLTDYVIMDYWPAACFDPDFDPDGNGKPISPEVYERFRLYLRTCRQQYDEVTDLWDVWCEEGRPINSDGDQDEWEDDEDCDDDDYDSVDERS